MNKGLSGYLLFPAHCVFHAPCLLLLGNQASEGRFEYTTEVTLWKMGYFCSNESYPTERHLLALDTSKLTAKLHMIMSIRPVLYCTTIHTLLYRIWRAG